MHTRLGILFIVVTSFAFACGGSSGTVFLDGGAGDGVVPVDGGCPANDTICGKVCVDTATDFGNCGACGNACPMGRTCTAGACVALTCAAPTANACAGACVDVATDVDNCGRCGVTCGAGGSCAMGTCTCGAGA